MKRFVLALTLMCALSGTALAGLIPTTDVTPPPPPPPDEITTTGDIPALDFLLSVLGLVF